MTLETQIVIYMQIKKGGVWMGLKRSGMGELQAILLIRPAVCDTTYK
jgi:hypothetical protein